MFGFFSSRKSLIDSGLLIGCTDSHSHILWGVDDGVRTPEESLTVMKFLEGTGLKTLWLTPHTMEDVPNTTEGLKKRFEEFKAKYTGPVEVHLASEYMLDNGFNRHLADKDFLLHGEDMVLVETSTVFPPIDFWDVLEKMMKAGYRPLIAHPERYVYLNLPDYEKLFKMGCRFQLNIPSLVGVYGQTVQTKALAMLDKGWYCMAGSDCHRYHAIRMQLESKVLKSDTLTKLQPLLHPEIS
jgi:tyrosine-protein phosphatase YwqE